MSNDFSETMSGRTDEELITIVTVDRDGHQPAAVDAAGAEIKRRGIDTSKVEEVKAVLTTKREDQKAFDESKASSWARLLHFAIDTIAFIVLARILSFVADLFFKTDNQAILAFGVCAIFSASFFTYYIFMEHNFQKTLGKLITKTKVVRNDGHRAELGDIVRRTFCRLLPFDNVSYLFTRDGFHDCLSDTTVINATKDKP